MEKDNLLPDFVFADDDEIVVEEQTPGDGDKNANPNHNPDSGNNPPIEEQPDDAGQGDDDNASDAEEDDSKGDGSDDEGEDPNIIAAFQFYTENGILPPRPKDKPFDGKLESLQDELLEAHNASVEKAIDSIITPLPDYGQALVALALEKKDKLTIEDIESLVARVKPLTLSVNDMEDTAKAYDYMVSKYQRDGYNLVDAKDMADLLKDKGTLSDNAKRFFSKDDEQRSLEAKAKVDESKKSREKQRINDQVFQKNFAQAISSQGWPAAKSDQVVESFMSGKFKKAVNHILYENPNALVQLIDFIGYYDENKKAFNLDTFKKEAFTPSTKKVVENMRQNLWSNSGGQRKQKEDTNSRYEFVD